MNEKWVKLIEELESECITPEAANRMIRGYQMIESVMETVKKIEPTKK